MRRAFELLSGAFGVLLMLPAVVFFGGLASSASVHLAKAGAEGPSCEGEGVCVRPSDFALAGILTVGSTVIFTGLANGSRVALHAAASGSVSVALLLCALAPSAGRAWPQDIALAVFLLAGALTLLLTAAMAPERTSMRATEA